VRCAFLFVIVGVVLAARTAGAKVTAAEDCAALAGLQLADTEITSAQAVPAGSLPAYCKVLGIIDRRIGVGVVNQKLDHAESVDEIVARARRAIDIFGAERVLLTPDCGFATFADSPVASAAIAETKLAAIKQAAERLRHG